jgi:hypothetical protein
MRRTSLPLPYWIHIIYHCHPHRFKRGYGVALARRLDMPQSTVHRLVRTIQVARASPGMAGFLAALDARLEARADRVNAVDPAIYRRVPRGRGLPKTAELPEPRRDDPVLAWYLSRIDWPTKD